MNLFLIGITLIPYFAAWQLLNRMTITKKSSDKSSQETAAHEVLVRDSQISTNVYRASVRHVEAAPTFKSGGQYLEGCSH